MNSIHRVSTPRSEQNELIEHLEKWSTFVLANIVWAILSIPVITLPAATAGLFGYLSKRARGQQPDFFATFFGSVQRHWRKATVIALLNVLVGGLVIANFFILPMMDFNTDPLAFLARSVTLFMALTLLLLNLYAWSLMVLLEKMSVVQLIRASASLVFAHPLWSLLVLLGASVPVVISLFLPQGMFVIATISVCVLIICKGTWRVIRAHLSPEQLSLL